TGFRGLYGGANCSHIPHLPHQDDVGVLTHSRPERDVEISRVLTHFSLINYRPLIAVQNLNRIFDRDNIDVAFSVDRVNHPAQSRRLTRTRGASNQHNSSRLES